MCVGHTKQCFGHTKQCVGHSKGLTTCSRSRASWSLRVRCSIVCWIPHIMCCTHYTVHPSSGSEAGTYFRLMDFVYHSTLGLRVINKKRLRNVRVRNLFAVAGLLSVASALLDRAHQLAFLRFRLPFGVCLSAGGRAGHSNVCVGHTAYVGHTTSCVQHSY